MLAYVLFFEFLPFAVQSHAAWGQRTTGGFDVRIKQKEPSTSEGTTGWSHQLSSPRTVFER